MAVARGIKSKSDPGEGERDRKVALARGIRPKSCPGSSGKAVRLWNSGPGEGDQAEKWPWLEREGLRERGLGPKSGPGEGDQVEKWPWLEREGSPLPERPPRPPNSSEAHSANFSVDDDVCDAIFV